MGSASSRTALKQKLRKFRALQIKLARKVDASDSFTKRPTVVAGFDLAFPKKGLAVAAAVVFREHEVVESKHKIVRLTVPYVPTFLGLREGPAIISLYKKLSRRPDIMMVNGHGLAHPYRCGLATYVGIKLEVPTIGVAASRLTGYSDELPKAVGTWRPLREGGETVGAVLKTRPASAPIYVSVGHMVSLSTAVAIVFDQVRGNRFPEPIVHADRLANSMARQVS